MQHVRSQLGNESLAAPDIIRHSTRVKRQFPGLSLESHVKRVCLELAPPKLCAAVIELRDMFPHVEVEYLERILASHEQSIDRAATALIRDGCLRRKPDNKPSDTSNKTLDPGTQRWYTCYLANTFPWTSVHTVRSTLQSVDHDLVRAHTILAALPMRELSVKRAIMELPEDGGNMEACFAIAKSIADARAKTQRRRLAIQAAAKAGNTQTCSVCYDTFTRPETLVCGSGEHAICEPCALQYVTTELFDSGRATTKCVLCAEQYNAKRIRELLPPRACTAFDMLESRAALVAAGITDSTHTCTKCGNVVLLSEGVTVHRCSACGHATCVLCNEDDHLPLRCDQVETAADASVRHKIEEAMTAALVRKCVCGQTFLKESGCNKMTCRCGRKMCYLCRQPIESYDHFYNDSPCKLFAEADDDDRVEEAERAARAAHAAAGLASASDTNT